MSQSSRVRVPAASPTFSLSRMLPELRWPALGFLAIVLAVLWVGHEEHAAVLPQAGGFAVYLTNPVLLIGLAVIVIRALRGKADDVDVLLLIALLVHAVMLLSHRTNGGWQYGTRYLVDLLPAAVYAVARGGALASAHAPVVRGGVRVSNGGALLMGALITFNLYAAVVFETASS